MEAERYSCPDHAALIAELSGPELLERWRQYSQQELPRCGDAALIRHLKSLLTVAAQVSAQGLPELAEADAPAVDALLTDVFAVATWEQWPLPVESMGRSELPLGAIRRGLLGADESRQGAELFALDDGTLALSRSRQADHNGDMDEHWRATGHPFAT